MQLSTGFPITGTLDGGAPSYPMLSLQIPSSPFFIRAQVNGTCTNHLIDTGSSITIVNRHFLQRIHHNTFKPLYRSYVSANRTNITVVGEVQLEIKINGLITHITASVAPNLVTDVLVGTNWITY